jgi:hypothetical protein
MDGRQEPPLVMVGAQFRINENAITVLTRHLLQGQCDQVGKAALGIVP